MLNTCSEVFWVTQLPECGIVSTMQITQKHSTAFLHTCKGISVLWVWNLVCYTTGTTAVAL